jgi:hypothetical protein
MALIEFQPLRIPSGWTIEWNTFMESDPHPDNMSDFSGSSLLHAYNDHAKRAINLTLTPEEDFEGEFYLRVINLYEDYNHQTNKVDLTGIWEAPHYEFRSKSRLEVVIEIERLMLQLKPYVDPRILKSPGLIDDVAEPLRLQLQEKGTNSSLVTKIIESKNKVIQGLLIDDKTVRKADLEKLIELGATKGIKKKAAQKLNSKTFKNRN